MSLKAVHIVFVTALSALAFGTAIWKFRDYFGQPERATGDLLYGLAAVVAGVAVLFYGRYFLKKMRTVGYL